MKQYWFYLIIIAAVISIPPVTMTAERGGDKSASFNDCDSRCVVLEGDSRYQCLKTCISTRKKNAPAGENEVKKKINECESICEPYKGIENVRCRRICLDNRRYIPPKKKEPDVKDNPSPCESRCSVLSGSLKENCVARCEKKNRFESRGLPGK